MVNDECRIIIIQFHTLVHNFITNCWINITNGSSYNIEHRAFLTNRCNFFIVQLIELFTQEFKLVIYTTLNYPLYSQILFYGYLL